MDDEVDHDSVSLSCGDSGFAADRLKKCGGPHGTAKLSGGEGNGWEGECGVSREDIMRRLEALRVEHRDLDSAIDVLLDGGAGDQMQIARFKKRKLRLRDEIALLEDALVPDIIA